LNSCLFSALMSRYFVYNGFHFTTICRSIQKCRSNILLSHINDIFQRTSPPYRVAYCATEQSLHQ